MKFNIESLKIRYFKGIIEQDITFDDIETTICGENGTGKTTVVDAFNWLLFEKDSKGRAEFEIKTLKNGEVMHGLDHLVEGMFKIDGRNLKLRKIYKEIWTLKKGDTQETFTGHKIERFINDVPVTKTDYNKRINELIDEKIFQLLTDPLHFSQTLHWKERRKALFELAGDQITKEEILKTNPNLKHIESDLEDKTIEELREALKYQRRQLDKERENIPVRIQTLNETIKEIDGATVDIKIRGIKGSLQKIEGQMLDSSQLGEQQLNRQEELYKLKGRQREIEYELKENIKDPDEETKKEIDKIVKEAESYEPEFKASEREIERLKSIIAREEEELAALRKGYGVEVARKIEVREDIKECPTCKRAFPEEDIHAKVKELEGNFKDNQVRELKRLRDRGTRLSQDVEEQKRKLEKLIGQQEGIKEIIDRCEDRMHDQHKLLGTKPMKNIQDILAENKEYQETRTKIEELEAELQNRTATTEVDELRIKKVELEDELKELEKQLHQEEINKETEIKIEELMTEEKELSRKISKIEKKETVADQYITTQAELIEKNINEKFKEVSFRLFKKQTNGGLDPTCDVLVEGVPFDNANTAGQVNAGLDIINGLCKYYDSYAPILIDNRERVSEIIETSNQVINLVKPPTWKELDKEIQIALAGVQHAGKYTDEDNKKIERAKKDWNSKYTSLTIKK